MSEISNQYWAGLFDGEGHVSMSIHTVKGYPAMQVGVTQKNPTILYLLKQAFGGNVYKKTTGNICHGWRITSTDGMRKFLETIQPYCLTKAHDVRIGLEFLSGAVSSSRGYHPLSQEERSRREGLMAVLKSGRQSNSIEIQN